MKELSLIILAASVAMISPSKAQSRLEEALYSDLSNNGPARISIAALEKVLKNSEEFSAVILYTASGVAFREKRSEDAGFLFYVAQFRARFDAALFPPLGTGGNSPMVLFGALQQQLGGAINPAIMREPKTYAKIVGRIKSWKPKAPPDYEPGWEHAKRIAEKEAEEAVARNRKEFIDHMSGLSTLLLDSDYFRAFETVQDYNLNLAATNRPSREAYNGAVLTLKRIEKEKGIEGVGAVMR